MRLAWTSDLHFVFLAPSPRDSSESLTPWLAALARQPFDALAISRDISEAPRLREHLTLLATHVQRPIYFVLGNHDFYHGSFAEVYPAVRDVAAHSPILHCLDLLDVVELTPTTALVGHGCWGDGMYGDFFRSEVVLNDWKVIEELRKWKRGPGRLSQVGRGGMDEAEVLQWTGTTHDVDRASLAVELRMLGDRAAAHVGRVLPRALEARPRVVMLTHTPPFAPRGVPTKVDWESWAPHAGCKAVGDAVERIMADYPDRQLLILSGHIHAPSRMLIARNIEQRTASARYGRPQLEDILELPAV